jgi:hypothetical protein
MTVDRVPDNHFEITDADGPVRSALIVNGITPMTCQEKGKREHRDFIENKKRLLEYVKSRNKVLILITPRKVGSK